VKAAILGTGYYVPTKIVTNDDLSKTLDTSDEWIYSHTGIKNRRIAAEDEAASDLGIHAANTALKKAGLSPEEVDMILVATTSPDYASFPSTASIIQDKIGAAKAGAMDLSAACTGFVYAMETARAFIEAGTSKYILVIGTEVFSRILNWEDRNTCILFGDAAGAVVVGPSKSDQSHIAKAILRSDGSGAEVLCRPVGGTKVPIASGITDLAPTLVYMDGRKVYNFAVKVVKDMILEILELHGKTVEDVAHIVPHQANVRIIQAASKRLNIPMEKFYTNMDQYANTSGASIPLALGEMEEQGLLKAGDLIVTVGFGAGLTYGANIIYW
jgi:3-oxoacyl-[acyl-carrier-protein] synthase-3